MNATTDDSYTALIDADKAASAAHADYLVSHPIVTAIECIKDADITETVLMRIICATLRRLEKSNFAHREYAVTAIEKLEDAMFLLEQA